jgi:hypothetical protein
VLWLCQILSWFVKLCWWLKASLKQDCWLGSLSLSTHCAKNCFRNR